MIVSLIIPPSPFLGDEKRNAPLGILYIASWLEYHNHKVYVTDLRGVEQSMWGNEIKSGDFYGITATTPEYPYAKEIGELLKNGNNTTVVLGGIHATSNFTNIDKVFDKVVVGEGELSILNVIDDIKNNREKRIYFCPQRIKNLDELPFPARHLVPKSSIISYASTIRGEPTTTIIGSRGCSYDCSFCSSKVIWDKKTIFRSPDNIITEIRKLINEYDVRHFRFQDDTITIKRSWILELCEKIQPLNVVWRCTTRVNHSSEDILKAMKNSGCYEIAYGIESLEDKTLMLNNKQITNVEILNAVNTAHKVGLKTRLFFMIGLPNQDDDIADKIIEFIERVKPNAVNLSTFVPMPGSDIYNNPSKYGIKLFENDWSKYVISKGLYDNELSEDFMYDHDKLSNEKLKSLRKKLLEYFNSHNLVYNK